MSELIRTERIEYEALVEAVLNGHEKVLTPGELAALVRVDEKSVTRWAAANRIRRVYTGGGHRRYPISEVRAMLRGDSLERRSE